MIDPWLSLVPTMFRALADDDVRDSMPAPSTDSLEHACGYWGALHYLFSSVIGWSDVGRGLAWWYSAGKPVEDSPQLALAKKVWGEQDLIDYYAAWAWKPADTGYLYAHQTSDGPSPTWLAANSLWRDEDWWRAFVRRGQEHHHDPFYGGTDALHLEIHDGPPSIDPSGGRLTQLFPAQYRGILVTGGLDHWLADLKAIEPDLPDLPNGRSWHIEVFDRRAGYLGTYRLSRVTGRWFAGKHSIHMRGQPAKP